MNDGYSHKAAILAVLAVVLYVTCILPYKLYSLNVIDRHYFGFFDDLEPQVAVTTAEERAYKARSEPYKTLHDINVEKREEHRRIKEGERGQWDHHYEKFYLSNVAGRMMEAMSSSDIVEELGVDYRNLEDVATDISDPLDDSADSNEVIFNSKFPEAFFSESQIKNGGFLVYFAGT